MTNLVATVPFFCELADLRASAPPSYKSRMYKLEHGQL